MIVVLELTVPEANALYALLDMAVKAGGLAVAENAVALTAKLKEAARLAQEKPND